MRLAILDDAEGFARTQVDWAQLPDGVDMEVLGHHEDADDLARRLADVEIVLGMRERTAFPRALLERLPSLQLLITTGRRNASFDIAAATDLGIVVAGAPGAGQGTAELTWALILAVLRRVVVEDRAVRQGRWGTTVGVEVAGRTLGILGLGRVGGAVARIAQAFDMQVLAWSPNLTPDRAAADGATAVAMHALLRRADVVSLHLRLTDDTRGMIGAHELGLLRSTAVVINTSRGPVIDEAALLAALRSGAIAGAGLDVYAKEPLPPGHPLTALDNVVLLPHRGYVTDTGFAAFYRNAIEVIDGMVTGRAVRVLNPEVLDSPRLRAAHLRDRDGVTRDGH
jgi:phosphoglycerate dehydrogenase-like enzyme